MTSTSVNGPAVDFTMFGNFSKHWRGAMNIGATFLNGANSNSTIGSNAYLGEVNVQAGYQVIPKFYVYGLVGVAGINNTSNINGNSNGYTGFEWGGGVSYDLVKYMGVYAQYTGQSLQAAGLVNATGTLFTAGLQFHIGAF
jgi:opacity protein-like surface antigen